jgi:catechol-2,3-dioxygenase
MRFFTSNPEIDHEIAVTEIGEDAVGPFPDQVGLYHMAWELADMEELKDAYQVVLDNNVDIAGFGDHGVTKGLYIRDPDGIEIELYFLAPEFENTPLQEILTGGTLQSTSAD